MEGRRLVSQVVGVAAGVTLAAITSAVASAPPAPVGYEAKVLRAMAIDDLTETGAWTPRGPETSVALDDKLVKVGERSLRFDIKVDFHNESTYPVGWPAVTCLLRPHVDWSAYNTLAFWARVDDHADKPPSARRYPLRPHLRSRGQNIRGVDPPRVAVGSWQRFFVSLSSIGARDRMEHVQWFICESDYGHGDHITFYIDGLELLQIDRVKERLPDDQASARLVLGDPTWATLLDSGSGRLQGKASITTGDACVLSANDKVRFTFHDVFRSFGQARPGWTRVKKGGLSIPTRTLRHDLGVAAAPGKTTEVPVAIPVTGLGLEPGYYYVTMDLVRNGKSVVGGRVGCDDVYVKATGETVPQAALGYRTGIGLYARDLLFGGIMSKAQLRLPGTYDPLLRATYLRFVQAHLITTGKVAEHFEMGIGGATFGAAAFRALGQVDRARFLEWLIKDSVDYLIQRLLLRDGSTLTMGNELVREHGWQLLDKGSPWGGRTRSADQTAENLRTLARAVLHLRTVPTETETVRRYLEAGRRTGDFLVRHSTKPMDGRTPLMYFNFVGFGADLTRSERTQQEGSPCWVYHPRITAGVNYMAFALAMCGEQVPGEWDRVLRDSTSFHLARLAAHGGYYDPLCADRVEGGCHRPLGNLYAAEALMGQYLYARAIGDAAEMKRASDGMTTAAEFLVDHGGRGGAPYVTNSQWVVPYMYWLFTEYLTSVGPKPKLQAWMASRRRDWEVTRRYHDSFGRVPPKGGRQWAGGERLSQLGFTGCRVLEDLGKPFSYWPKARPPARVD